MSAENSYGWNPVVERSDADRIRFNMGQQRVISKEMAQDFADNCRRHIECRNHNLIGNKRSGWYQELWSHEGRVRAEFEIQQMELLLSEIEVVFGVCR